MSTLIIADHNNQQLNPATLNACSAALQLGEPLHLLVLGHHCQFVVEQASVIDGVSLVLVADDASCEHFLAEQLAPIVVKLGASYQTILAPSTSFAKDLLPRVAACLNVAQISDVIGIEGATRFKHPIYAGNAIQEVESLDPIRVLTIRTTAFEPITKQQPACITEQVAVETHASKTQFMSHQLSESTRPELARAKIIVSGGRGLQSAEKFKLVEDLADVLGAAVGASRAAVDAGFVPNDYQVGQTGKVVAPEIYIAVGISGAIQHLAGMKDSKMIVAINKDEDAPIFQIATYGLVGDLFEIVPSLIQLLKK